MREYYMRNKTNICTKRRLRYKNNCEEMFKKIVKPSRKKQKHRKMLEYYQENRGEIRSKQGEYYRENRDQIHGQKGEYNRENRDQIRGQRSEYY